MDVKTGSVNDVITPNRNLRIKGFKLKLAGDNPAVGVFFINQLTNERTKVEASEIVNACALGASGDVYTVGAAIARCNKDIPVMSEKDEKQIFKQVTAKSPVLSRPATLI